MCATLEIKLLPFFRIKSWSASKARRSFWDALLLSCVKSRTLQGLLGQAYSFWWLPLFFLVEDLWKRVMAVRGSQPACSTCYIQPNAAPLVGSPAFSLWDAEIGSALGDSVGSETQMRLPLACVTWQSWIAFSVAVWVSSSWRTAPIGHEELPTADEAIHHPLLLLAVEGFLNQEEWQNWLPFCWALKWKMGCCHEQCWKIPPDFEKTHSCCLVLIIYQDIKQPLMVMGINGMSIYVRLRN